MLGLGLSVTQLAVRGLRISDLAAAIRALFAAGEQGVWYDPSDLTTLYQDAAGTIPVTAVEQPVGLMRDKSGRGNHATQTTSTSRPVLSARVNLLNSTEDIRSSSWSPYQSSQITATKFVPNSSNLEHYIANSTSKIAGAVQYVARVDVKDEGYGFAPMVIGNWIGYYASNGWYFCVDLSNGNYTAPETFGSDWPVGTVSISRNAETGVCTVSVTFTAPASSTRVGLAVYAYPSLKSKSPFNFSGNGVSGIYCSKIDLRVANDGVGLSAYQRVNTSTDYDTVGFPHYLRFDGVDDFLVTPTITPGIDKAQVFAGVRKLSDATAGMIAELSANAGSNAGSLYFVNADNPSLLWSSNARGSVSLNVGQAAFTTTPAPDTAVIAATHDIAGDLSTLRRNAIDGTNGTADKGTGNYLDYPLYIGRRAGTTLPFNGHLYGLIVRFGANLPTQAITDTETWLNGKTRAYA